MDATAVRAEIKAWEHAFKKKNSRDPTVQDIKDEPAVAEKYKLYKRLSRVQVPAANTKHSAIPSTPPRSSTSSQPPHSIVPKSRATPSADPPSETNPFSPVKSKGKNVASTIAPGNDAPPPRNPFATPSNSKARPLTTRRDLSPESFPEIELSKQVGSSGWTLLRDPLISKARKRLRGDPVSPSPQRNEKKRRKASFHDPHPHRIDSQQWASSEDSEDVEDGGGVDSSYVDESPVKAPAGGKGFKLLFEEAQPVNGRKSHPKGVFQTSRHTLSAERVRPAKLSSSSTIGPSGDEMELLLRPKQVQQPLLNFGNARGMIPRGVLPGRDDLTSHSLPSTSKNVAQVNGDVDGHSKNASSSRKRALSPHNEGDIEAREKELVEKQDRVMLLPPSPPPPDSTSKSGHPSYQGKGKGKATDRKKARLTKGDGIVSDSSPDDSDNVKDVAWAPRARSKPQVSSLGNPSSGDDLDYWDFDPVLQLDRRLYESTHLLSTFSEEADTGKFEVNLPDDLREMLAISPSRSRHREEDSLVKSVLFGGGYGIKGGEVWGVGEIDAPERGDAEYDEDDWAGEGTPWEVGEL